jgi:hypothetical protein
MGWQSSVTTVAPGNGANVLDEDIWEAIVKGAPLNRVAELDAPRAACRRRTRCITVRAQDKRSVPCDAPMRSASLRCERAAKSSVVRANSGWTCSKDGSAMARREL